MKRLFLSFITATMLTGPVLAGNIDILPTMQSKSMAQDRVWVGTFQLVWNDFVNKIAFYQVKFPNGTPAIVNELNKQEFTSEDLSKKSFYKYAGPIKSNTKSTISRALRRKFYEKSDILNQIRLTPGRDKILVYAMLKKDFKFKAAFDKLGTSDFRGETAEFFGINANSNHILDKNVEVLFYNNPSDYAVKLETQGKDYVYLYRTSNTKPFNYIYEDMLKKQSAYEGDKQFHVEDMLSIPNLKFYEEKVFDEICGNRVKGTNLYIDSAMETVKFEMNNVGVKLKSEAAIAATMSLLEPDNIPRYFLFNDTFILFLKEKSKEKPYFALRVHNIHNFQD